MAPVTDAGRAMTRRPARRCSECPDRTQRMRAEPVEAAVDRAADHAAIDRLTDELLPALIAKLGATGLGELEVREGGWRVRLRRPAGDGRSTASRRPGERKAGDRGGRGERSDARPGPCPEREPRTLASPAGGEDGPRRESRAVATSPAVGIYPAADRPVGRGPGPGRRPARRRGHPRRRPGGRRARRRDLRLEPRGVGRRGRVRPGDPGHRVHRRPGVDQRHGG